MLELLIPISLDPLEKCGQRHLLLSSQACFLLFNYGLNLLLLAISFFLLLEITLHIQLLCLLIPFRVHELLNFFAHVHELFGEGDLQCLFLPNLIMQLLNLKQVLLFQLLEG